MLLWASNNDNIKYDTTYQLSAYVLCTSQQGLCHPPMRWAILEITARPKMILQEIRYILCPQFDFNISFCVHGSGLERTFLLEIVDANIDDCERLGRGSSRTSGPLRPFNQRDASHGYKRVTGSPRPRPARLSSSQTLAMSLIVFYAPLSGVQPYGVSLLVCGWGSTRGPTLYRVVLDLTSERHRQEYDRREDIPGKATSVCRMRFTQRS